MKKKLRIDLVLAIILVMCGFILSTFGFIHTMLKYTRIGNISKDDLQYEKLTFEKYEVIEVYFSMVCINPKVLKIKPHNTRIIIKIKSMGIFFLNNFPPLIIFLKYKQT